MDNDNRIIGCYPEIKNSSIIFSGINNILYCDPHVMLENTTLEFAGNNSIIYLSSNRYKYKLDVTIYNDSVYYMGTDNYMNKKMTVIVSERRHCFIGDRGAFSLNIWMRTADPHLIYSCSDGNRLNLSKSIYIGDHVWIGQDVRILKGTQIDSGSMIGAMSVVSGKRIPHNSVWAGNPCRQICGGAFWDIDRVHRFTNEKTEKSMYYPDYISEYKQGCHDDYWCYEHNAAECLRWDELEKHFSYPISSYEKYQYLSHISEHRHKNRFVHI